MRMITVNGKYRYSRRSWLMIQKWCYSFSQFLSDFVTITINCVLFTCWSVIGIQKCSLWMWCAEQSASIRCIFFLSRLPMRQYLRITWKCAISLSASMPYGHFNPSELAIRFLTTCHAFLTNLNLNSSSFSNFWKGDFLVLVVFLFFANTNFNTQFSTYSGHQSHFQRPFFQWHYLTIL